MAASLNLGTWIGNLGRDPELRPVGSTQVCEVSIACTDKVKRGDKWEPVTTWVPCKFWGRTAEVLAEYAGKGDPICVVGALRQDEWQDKQTGEKRSKLYVNVDKLQLLGSKSDDSRSGSRTGQPSGGSGGSRNAGAADDVRQPTAYDDDIPF